MLGGGGATGVWPLLEISASVTPWVLIGICGSGLLGHSGAKDDLGHPGSACRPQSLHTAVFGGGPGGAGKLNWDDPTQSCLDLLLSLWFTQQCF